MRTVRSSALIVAIVALLTVGAGVAMGHTFRAESDVTIRYNAEKSQFQGRVTSEKPSCVRNRTVVVFRRTPGQDPEVGRDRTNTNGRWKVEVNAAQGRFYARVLRRVRTPEGHRHVCKAARSETIEVGRGN